MKKSLTYGIWAGLFVICVGLSLLGNSPTVKNIFAVLFFLPPVLLIFQGEAKRIFYLSAAALGLSMLCLISIFLSARSEGLGLTIVTSIAAVPMLLCTYWPESLFLWACLLFGSRKRMKG